MKVRTWRSLATVVALVITVYLVGSWIAIPGIALGEIVTMCTPPINHWIMWVTCPDRAPRTAELASVAVGLAALVWVAWIAVRRIGRSLVRREAKPTASE